MKDKVKHQFRFFKMIIKRSIRIKHLYKFIQTGERERERALLKNLKSVVCLNNFLSQNHLNQNQEQ